jgi:hypothetical protein
MRGEVYRKLWGEGRFLLQQLQHEVCARQKRRILGGNKSAHLSCGLVGSVLICRTLPLVISFAQQLRQLVPPRRVFGEHLSPTNLDALLRHDAKLTKPPSARWWFFF